MYSNKYMDENIIKTYYLIKYTEEKIDDEIIQLILNYTLLENNVLKRLKDNYQFFHVKYILPFYSENNLIELY